MDCALKFASVAKIDQAKKCLKFILGPQESKKQVVHKISEAYCKIGELKKGKDFATKMNFYDHFLQKKFLLISIQRADIAAVLDLTVDPTLESEYALSDDFSKELSNLACTLIDLKRFEDAKNVCYKIGMKIHFQSSVSKLITALLEERRVFEIQEYSKTFINITNRKIFILKKLENKM